jgi:hypothetical protein
MAGACADDALKYRNARSAVRRCGDGEFSRLMGCRKLRKGADCGI